MIKKKDCLTYNLVAMWISDVIKASETTFTPPQKKAVVMPPCVSSHQKKKKKYFWLKYSNQQSVLCYSCAIK